jgi:hypothetical protein
MKLSRFGDGLIMDSPFRGVHKSHVSMSGSVASRYVGDLDIELAGILGRF